MRIVHGLAELKGLVGQELGVSEWLQIDQSRIQRFADATGDQQWIHVNPKLAAKGPYGTTIAHGYLSLSVLTALAGQIYEVEGLNRTVNYGLDKVRFPSIVPVNSRVRDRIQLLSVTSVRSGTQAIVRHTLELEGSDRPGCVAEQIRLMVE